jgi:hypothetical protein
MSMPGTEALSKIGAALTQNLNQMTSMFSCIERDCPFFQGTLAEREGSVRWTSMLR